MISELSKRVQEQVDAARNADAEARAADAKKLQILKAKVRIGLYIVLWYTSLSGVYQ